MPTLKQFQLLDGETRKAIIDRVTFRKHRFLALTQKGFKCPGAKILIVGDCPAPSADADPQGQFTPFGALWNCSLFLNTGLHVNGIPEEQLAWVNAADSEGVLTNREILNGDWQTIIALGGNAEKWVKQFGKTCIKFNHPAYHTRFKSGTPYGLFPFLKKQVEAK